MMTRLMTATAVLALATPAMADTADRRIALSNNYAGNSWRQAMRATMPPACSGTR